MPNRAVHDFLTVASSVIITPITYSILSSTPEARDWATVVAALVFVSHNVSGILFSPDLDMDTHIHKRWGLFYVLWVPYQMVIPHRHFWSHGLVVPPLLRLGYFFWMCLLVLLVVESIAAYFGIQVPELQQSVTRMVLSFVGAHPIECVTIAAGFVSGATVHSIADWLVSGGAKLVRMVFVPPRRAQQKSATTPQSVSSRWLIDPFSNDYPRHV
jgi:uncharacterized metal-binding protein